MQVGSKSGVARIDDGRMWAPPQPRIAEQIPLAGFGLSEVRFALPVDNVAAETITSMPALLQGNQRAVCRQSYDGDLVELFSGQGATKYPRNMIRRSLFACNWLEFDIIRFCATEGDRNPRPALSWQVVLDGDEIRTDDLKGTYLSTYAGEVIPVTQWQSPLLECTVFTFAPQDGSTRIRGAIYVLQIRNRTQETIRGRVVLRGSGDIGKPGRISWDESACRMMYRGRSMLGNSEAYVTIAPRDKPVVGSFEGEPTIEWDLALEPGQVRQFSISIALGESLAETRQQLASLESRPASDWLRQTVDAAASPIGSLTIESGEWWAEFLLNHMHRGSNALRLNAQGQIIGAAVAPEMLSETVNREDLFRGMQVHHLFAPSVFREFVSFSCQYLTPPPAVPFEENTAPNVHLAIVAEMYYRATGDTAFFLKHPEIGRMIEDLLARLLKLRAPSHWLFPAEEVSDGHTLKEYDFCTNVQIWRAFLGAARVMADAYGRRGLGVRYERIAKLIRQDILETMTVDGVFGPQFAAATDLESAVCFMDGEDDLGALAPYLGFCEFSDLRWRNYCRHGLSAHNPIYDAETSGLIWIDDPNIGHTIGTPTAPSFASRVAAAVTRDEVAEEMRRVRALADIDTTFYWYPASDRVPGGLCHSLWMTGSVSTVIVSHYLGIDVDVPARQLVFKPWSPWHSFAWEEARLGTSCFSLRHVRGGVSHASVVTNLNGEPWSVTLGFYIPSGMRCDEIVVNGHAFEGEMETKEHFGETLTMITATVGAGQVLRAMAIMNRSSGEAAAARRQQCQKSQFSLGML